MHVPPGQPPVEPWFNDCQKLSCQLLEPIFLHSDADKIDCLFFVILHLLHLVCQSLAVDVVANFDYSLTKFMT